MTELENLIPPIVLTLSLCLKVFRFFFGLAFIAETNTLFLLEQAGRSNALQTDIFIVVSLVYGFGYYT